jgi:anti-sigma B factor antagonist
MALTFESHWAGEVAVVKCSGRIVEGRESAALQQHLNDVISENPYVVLHLGAVEFIDSSGLGLLLRCLTRAQNAQGHLKVCAISSRISDALRITKLTKVVDSYDTEAEAIAAFYHRSKMDERPFLDCDILCVHQSPDVVAYLRGVLRQASYGVIASDNLPDALTLLTATRPRLVVIESSLRSARDTRAAENFNRLADAIAVVELPPDFSGRDAGEAGSQLLDRVNAILIKSKP